MLLYELLTGKTPFDAKELIAAGLDQMRRTIREQEPVRPSTRLSTMLAGELTATAQHRQADPPKLIHLVRGDLDWIVMKCLEKDRTRRYETANGVVTDLQRHLNNEPVVARPPSNLCRFQKLVRRNKVTFAGIAAVIMALMLGMVVSLWQAVRATRAEREQIHLREQAQANEQKAERAQADEMKQRRLAEQARKDEALQRERAEAGELAARQKAYASDMSLAQQTLALNNLGLALDLLNRQRPQPGQRDLRGWEWRYLWKSCQSQALCKLCQQTNSILSLSVSPDGKWLAIGEEEGGRVSIWDLRARQEIARLPAGENGVRTAFSPREPLLAFSTETGTYWIEGMTSYQSSVRLWNIESKQFGAELRLTGRCAGLRFSEDGKTLITSTANRRDDREGELTLWRLPEGKKLASYPAAQWADESTTFAVARDFSFAAVATSTLRLIDLSTGKERWSTTTDNDLFTSLAISHDGKILASSEGLVSSSIRFWDVATGKEFAPPLTDHRVCVMEMLFWPDGKTLATASGDQTIRLWDLSDPTHVRPRGQPLRGHRLEVYRIALLPDNQTLVSGCKDGSVCLWDTANPRDAHAPVTLPVKLDDWSFTPDSKSIVTADQQGRIALWRGDDFQEMKPLFELGTNVNGYCFSQDARLLAAGSTNGFVRIWDVQRGAVVQEFRANTNEVKPWRFLAHGHKLMIAQPVPASGWTDRLWDLTTERELQASWPSGTDARAGAFSPDERWFVQLFFGGASHRKDMVSGRDTDLRLDLRHAMGAAFSPDGKTFAAASWRGYTRLWETATWQEVKTLPSVLLTFHSVAFSPDGTRLMTGSNGQEAIQLWDTGSHQGLLALEGRGSLFSSPTFSPDGSLLGSMNQQGVLHLWRAPSWAEIQAAEEAEAKAQ